MKNNLPPGGIPQSQPSVQVDFSQATDVVCDRCGNATFQEVVLMKHLSAIASPTGRAGNVPIPTFACVACGWVNDTFLPPFMRKKKEEVVPEETPKPTISIVKG